MVLAWTCSTSRWPTSCGGVSSPPPPTPLWGHVGASAKCTATISGAHPSRRFPELQKCRTLADLKQVHASLIKTGGIRDPLAAAEVLRFCALSDPPFRDLRYALLVFSHMGQPNRFSWNTIIRALSESCGEGDSWNALFLFSAMVQCESVEPNRFTFPSVLKACAQAGTVEEGKQIHGMIVKFGLADDEFIITNLVRMYAICGHLHEASRVFTYGLPKVGNGNQSSKVVLCNVMIDGYIKLGDFRLARKLFDEMSQRSLVSWNSMISGYAQNRLFREAVQFFRDMQIGDVCPNHVTLVSVLPAISRLGVLELGKWVHLYAAKSDIPIDDVLGSALIDMYSKCGSIEKAIQVFESLPRRNLVTWNSIITGLAMHGRGEDAIDLFWRMEEEGAPTNDVTYIGVLSACSHAGLLQEGKDIFDHMVRVAGLEPRLEHYGCMVDLLGRAGNLLEAEELVLTMPMQPDDVILKALLGACKMHGNVEMGKRVAELLMARAPRDSGSYVALSNMYASCRDWKAMAEVRTVMKEMDIRKDPGCSWIELDGEIHEFLGEDDTHPRAKEIYMMLEEMSGRLRMVGYRPSTSEALLNSE